MINAIRSLNPLAVIVISIVTFLVGGLWYSPLLFIKAWFKEMKITPEQAKAAGGGVWRMATALALTFVSTFALAVLVAANHTTAAVKGAELGLFVGVGLVASREGVNGVFEMRSLRHYLIVAGHDVVQFAVAGALLALWH